ncbi:hypothetical protein OUZ56_010032 [Daphnia magna]|uniref:Uncharacterized protein n=1 Tax=Daphnia magna TaxID=35525 RepID=A0ABR0AHP6_9CRUS|nr:hypothetical protein OUZ56_010032 [Daphnia magna]
MQFVGVLDPVDEWRWGLQDSSSNRTDLHKKILIGLLLDLLVVISLISLPVKPHRQNISNRFYYLKAI